jgi:hypothetical protein
MEAAMTTKTTRDNSVMFALAQLEALEEQRVEAERVREQEAVAREAAARAAAEKEALEREEHARRVAEAEARVRVEASQSSADAERRMAALRAELSAVQADRERLHGRIVSIASEPIEPPRPRGRGWAAAFGAACVVVLGLALVIVTRQPLEPVIVEVPVAATSQAAGVEQPEATAPEIPSQAAPETIAAADTPEEPAATDRPRSGGTRGQGRTTDRDHTPGMHGTVDTSDTALDFSRCGDDPTCGAF